MCNRLCLDTYDRELERYGGVEGTAIAEAIFGADSLAVVEMLRLARHGLLRMDMTTLAVLSIDDLLAGLGATEADRLAWYQEQTTSRSRGEEYRKRKSALRSLLGDPDRLAAQPGGDALAYVLAGRGRELADLAKRLRVAAEAGDLSQTPTAMYRSYVHLHCNRLLAADPSAEDLVLELLKRTRYGLGEALGRRSRGNAQAAER